MTPSIPDKAVPTDEELRRLCENWLEDEALEVAADLERHGQLTLSIAIHEGRTMARALLSRLSAGSDAGVEWRPLDDAAKSGKEILAIWLWRDEKGRICGDGTHNVITWECRYDSWMDQSGTPITKDPSHYKVLDVPQLTG